MPAEQVYVFIKVRAVGKRAWWFLDGKGGETRLRIHAGRYPADKADKIAADIVDDNAGAWEAKVVPLPTEAPAKIKAWLHYGDAEKRPMQTVYFCGSRAALQRRVREAKRDNFPLRVQPDADADADAAAARP